MYNLKGKSALVTGASRKKGIGAAIAKALAQNGANLFLTGWELYDREMPWYAGKDEAAEIVDEIKSLGVRCEMVQADFSDSKSAVTLFNRAREFLKSVDILVNNAVCDIEANIFSLTEELMIRHLNINLFANMVLSREMISSFTGTHGSIINLTSGQSLAPMPESLPYAVTKSAIEGLTLSLSATAAKKGINVNAVDPGPTDTGWMSKTLHKELSLGSPFGRVGLPNDIANLAVFLSSEQGRWVTGQVIRSRGGL